MCFEDYLIFPKEFPFLDYPHKTHMLEKRKFYQFS